MLKLSVRLNRNVDCTLNATLNQDYTILTIMITHNECGKIWESKNFELDEALLVTYPRKIDFFNALCQKNRIDITFTKTYDIKLSFTRKWLKEHNYPIEFTLKNIDLESKYNTLEKEHQELKAKYKLLCDSLTKNPT